MDANPGDQNKQDKGCQNAENPEQDPMAGMECGSGVIGINGAAAHKAPVGSLIIIAAYAQMTPDEAREWHPTVIFPKNNRL